ncbi:MAG: hypothetical protein ACOZF0_09005 [Thermodesulfobacteriota bacterium]
MTPSPERPINWLQVVVGMIVLATGALVYLADRPPEAAYFVRRGPREIRLHEQVPNLFGGLGRNLPAFAHAFAFTAVTGAFIARGKKGYLAAAAAWFAVDAAFEIGQRYGAALADRIPAWFDSLPFLENTASFFRKGTFDWADLLAAALGSAGAFCFLSVSRKNEVCPKN